MCLRLQIVVGNGGHGGCTDATGFAQPFVEIVPGALRAGAFAEFADHLAVTHDMIVRDVELFLQAVDEKHERVDLLRRGLIDRKVPDETDTDAVLVDVRLTAMTAL